jgi:hypothetical protein
MHTLTNDRFGFPVPRTHKSPAKAAPKEPLQIRIPSDVKRRFKARAALAGLEPNQLFVEVWEHYERTKVGEGHRGANDS